MSERTQLAQMDLDHVRTHRFVTIDSAEQTNLDMSKNFLVLFIRL
jgi:hypothetical protein